MDTNVPYDNYGTFLGSPSKNYHPCNSDAHDDPIYEVYDGCNHVSNPDDDYDNYDHPCDDAYPYATYQEDDDLQMVKNNYVSNQVHDNVYPNNNKGIVYDDSDANNYKDYQNEDV